MNRWEREREKLREKYPDHTAVLVAILLLLTSALGLVVIARMFI